MADTPDRRHPLPWHMPGHEKWVHLEPSRLYDTDDEPSRPFQLRLGDMNSYLVSLSADDLRALRDACDAVLAAPFLVLVFGGDRAEPWMRERAATHLGSALRHHPSLEVAHAGRPGSIDEFVAEWAALLGLPQRVGPVDVAGGGNHALIFQTGDADRNLELAGAAHRAGIPSWWCRGPINPDQEGPTP